MHLHEAVARALCDLGVDTIFGVLGDANLFMMDSFTRFGGRYVSVANEMAAVLAANGYAQVSGRLGVATVTHGPALTNTVTALYEAVKERTPLLVLAGDTAAVDRENFQRLAQREAVAPTGAGFEQVRAPFTAQDDLLTAVRRAHAERRPVVLNIPVDYQWESVDQVLLERLPVAPQATAPSPEAMDAAVGAIASARRPVVLAGRGASNASSRAALLRLATRIGAPVATTLRGKDLFQGEPNDLGICGTLSNELASRVLSASDCIIAFGAGLNRLTTLDGALVSGKRLVHVDVDRASINLHTTASVGVVGDAAAVADELVRWLDEAEVPATAYAATAFAGGLSGPGDLPRADVSTNQTVDLVTALERIDAAFPADRTLVLDGGRFVFSAYTRLRVPHPTAYVHTVNFGSIGLGMGHAIGAAFGEPDRPVLLVTGDGGFMLGGITEFSTAVRHGQDLVVVVLNDGAYGAEHIQFRKRGLDPALATFAWPELGPVATALGGRGHTVRNLAELDAACAMLESRDRPVLIDIKIDPDRVSMGGH